MNQDKFGKIRREKKNTYVGKNKNYYFLLARRGRVNGSAVLGLVGSGST